MNSAQSFTGFLPPNAIVMANKSSQKNPILVMFVGKGLDEQEPAGQLLGKMIEAMGLNRNDVVIAESIEQAEALQPQAIVEFSETRATHSPHHITTFHPSYLLKNPEAKKQTWEDLKLVVKTLGIKTPKKEK